MSEASDLERTEPATPKRLEEAREKGQVARSRELSTFSVLLAAGCGFWFLGAQALRDFTVLVKRALQLEPAFLLDPMQMVAHLTHFSWDALWAIAPLTLLLLLAALFSPLLLNGWVFSAQSLQPDLSRLNPLAGLGKIFSTNGLVELLKALAKALLLGAFATWVLWHNRQEVFALYAASLEMGLAHLGHLLAVSFLMMVAATALIAAADAPYQLWQHHQQLKMTKQELRQEAKESEGNPQIKSRIRAQQREMSRRRMMAAVPDADVIVVNPLHYAVALKYSEDMRAPRVVAKGAHLLAEKIRDLAEEHRIPILQSPPLARSLYRHSEIGDEIPAALYTAVAEVLAYVFQLRRYRAQGGAMPQPPVDVAVPEGWEWEPL